MDLKIMTIANYRYCLADLTKVTVSNNLGKTKTMLSKRICLNNSLDQ